MEAHNSLGGILINLGKIQEAEISTRKAIELKPDSVEAYNNLSHVLLKSKQFQEGWEHYEWRWGIKVNNINIGTKLITTKPEWTPDQQGRLLVWAEQGIGDELMFLSLIPDLLDQVDQLIIKTDPRLIPLLKRSLVPSIRYIGKDDFIDESEYDSHIAMGSLPRFLRPSLESFEQSKQLCLKVNEQRSHKLRAQLINESCDKLVGISWKSKSTNKAKKWNSLSLEEFILGIHAPNIRFVNLQYGDVKQDIELIKERHGIEICEVEEVDKFHDIDDLAALIHACDEVVSTGNVTVPLTGAIRKKAHILVPNNCLWFWGINDNQSDWYPSLNIYRQSIDGDWGEALNHIHQAIDQSNKNLKDLI